MFLPQSKTISVLNHGGKFPFSRQTGCGELGAIFLFDLKELIFIMKLKFLPALAAVPALAVIAPVSLANAAPIGPYAAKCTAGTPSIVTRIYGFKQRSGIVRVQLYANNSKTFLEKGKYLTRIDIRVPASGAVDVCVPTPSQGKYAVSVRHMVSGSKSNTSDGGGMSGNPKISLSSMLAGTKPNMAATMVNVGANPVTVSVQLNYRQGLSIGPVKNPV